MFDDDASVLDFLSHCRKRFLAFPDGSRHVTAERFMRFPDHKTNDLLNNRAIPVTADDFANHDCPARPRSATDSLLVEVVGRTVDEQGQPFGATTSQEHYVEDRFELSRAAQVLLAKAATNAGMDEFRLPDPVARLLVGNAYLGMLDVNPLGGRQIGGKTDQQDFEIMAKRAETSENSSTRLILRGKSNVSGSDTRRGNRADGRTWRHTVKLVWKGVIDLAGDRITEFAVVANGREHLQWNSRTGLPGGVAEVAHLPAGRPIDLDCRVRYGLIGSSQSQ